MRLLTVLLMVAVTALPAYAALERQIIGGEQDHSFAEVGDCDRFYKTVFTRFPVEMREQDEREIPLTNGSVLKVTAGGEGGVIVRGWNRPHARLIVCRTAVAHTKVQARRVLDGIKVSETRGEIVAHGPAVSATQAWWTNMILYVPKRAAVDVHTTNGGVMVRNFDGRINAHATTGGISVASSTGQISIGTETGGITLDRVSGKVDAASRGGAIAFKVADAVPPLEARTGGGGQILCNISDVSWDPTRTQLRIGEGIPDVRLSTGNASIFIDVVRQ